MMENLHFLRPWWLVGLILLGGLLWRLWRYNPPLQSWRAVCDEHLLTHLIKNQSHGKRFQALILLFTAGFLACIGLAGPCWQRLAVPLYHAIQPRVVVLDMSENMLIADLKPDRLTRAKFKLHDLFTHQDTGQFGLVVYTGEPFVVSPLTEDALTIDALLETLVPDIMPIEGQDLSRALQQAQKLIEQAGFNQGQILVLTGTPPNAETNTTAAQLAAKGFYTSVIPLVANQRLNSLFKPLAAKGKGQLLHFNDTSEDIEHWLNATKSTQELTLNEHNDVPLWRDEGRWFLLPALFLLLPVFRRGWLQRIAS